MISSGEETTYRNVSKFYVLILTTYLNFDHILEKGGKLFKGGYYAREETN